MRTVKTVGTILLATPLLLGASGGGCSSSPERGTPVIEKSGSKPKKKKSKKGTPAVEYHCFTNAGKRTCTPKARP